MGPGGHDRKDVHEHKIDGEAIGNKATEEKATVPDHTGKWDLC